MKRLWGNALLALGGAALAVAVVEIALRIAGVSYPAFYTVDPAVGPTLRPGAEGWWASEGRSFVRISSAGLRDREHSRSKPPGTFRVAVLGDSYAEAFQVPFESAFWSVMEREIEACPCFIGKKAEAINFGVSGYGTAQELLTLRQRVWDYDPDLVLLAFTTGNDVRNNVRALENDPRIPYFVYRGEALALDNGYLDSWRYRLPGRLLFGLGYRLMNASRILQVANRAKNAYLSGRAAARQQAAAKEAAAARPAATPVPAAAPAAGTAPPPPPEPGLDAMVFREPADPSWKEAWRVTEGLIATMGAEVAARGKVFLVVTVSSGVQVHPDRRVREAFRRGAGAGDLFYPERRIEALCRRLGIPALVLGPPFLEHAESARVSLHGFGNNMGWGHWNREGHHLAGILIAHAICEECGKRRLVEPTVH